MRPRDAGRPTGPQQSSAGFSGAVLGDADDRSGFPPSSPRSGRPDLRPAAPFPTPGAGEDTADAQPGRVEDSAGRLRHRPADPPSTATAANAPAVQVELRPWEYSLAAQVGASRTAANHQKSDAGHYDRSQMEDDRTAQHAAAAAEIATARTLNRYWTACGAWAANHHGQYRDLADVGENIEVRRVRDAETTTFAVSEGDRERIIVAAYPEPPEFWTVRILGWIKADEAIAIGRPARYGGNRERFRVPIAALTLKGLA